MGGARQDPRPDLQAALLDLRPDDYQDLLQAGQDHRPHRAPTLEDHRPLVDGDLPAVDCSAGL